MHNLSLNLILSKAKNIMGGHAIDKIKRRYKITIVPIVRSILATSLGSLDNLDSAIQAIA